jgi:integrase
MPLTDKMVAALKPGPKGRFVADGEGLYVRVHPSGARVFMYRSRRGGSSLWITLGSYPSLSLAAARRKAASHSSGLIDSRMTVKLSHEARLLHIAKTYKSPLQVKQRMELHFVPKFGDKLLADVTRAEVSALLTKVAASAPVQANRLLTDIKLLFSYAVERGWLDNSPVALLSSKTVGGRESARDRVLDDDELRRLIGVLRTDRFAVPTRLALALCLLTGQRSGEVRGVTTAEVKGGVWTLPKQRTKNGKGHKVYLGKTPKLLFRLGFKALGSSPFGEMPNQVLSRATTRMAFTTPFTPHDLRRTMATHMAEMGVAPHVVEKCLNHTMAGVMAIYNRAEYADETRAAWRLWERKLLRLAREQKRSPRE